MHTKIFAPLALAASLALGLQVPLAAQAATMLPSSPKTITYNADLEGSSLRPIAGALLAGTMRLTLYPDGTIQGIYNPEDGNPLHVAGGLQQNGNVFLTIGQTTVDGQLMRDGRIVGSTYGSPALTALKFVAVPNNPGRPHKQQS
ncbi:MAG: hypothetical protein ACRENA_16125 [Vulcanimicrobiaceae bacterium]